MGGARIHENVKFVLRIISDLSRIGWIIFSCKKDTMFGAARKIVSPSYLTKVLKYVQGKILNLNFHLIIEMEVEILFMD